MFWSKKVPGTVVAVTGCDSGIGALTAARLAERGYTVLAGCLTEAGQAALLALVANDAARARVHPLPLDVTKEASIAAFAAAVKARAPYLYALVNNAGVGGFGMCDWVSMAQYRAVFEVNFFGMVAVTKALLPLLVVTDPRIKRRGRVVTMSSAAGSVAAPGWSPYSASKYAVEGFTDSLRREMSPYGVHVSLICPSFLKTPLVADVTGQFFKKTWDAADEETRARWGQAFYEDWAAKGAIPPVKEAESPELAAAAIASALSASKPKLRYRANWRSRTFYYYLTLLPGGCVDTMVASDPAMKPAAPPVWASAAVAAPVKAGKTA